MRLWAVNTEKAEEKSPLVGAIMVRNNTHRAVVSPKAQQCMHNSGGGGSSRGDGSSMATESILGYLAPIQPSVHAHCLSLEMTKVLCCHPWKLLTPPTVRHNSSQLLRAKAKDAFRWDQQMVCPMGSLQTLPRTHRWQTACCQGPSSPEWICELRDWHWYGVMFLPFQMTSWGAMTVAPGGQ